MFAPYSYSTQHTHTLFLLVCVIAHDLHVYQIYGRANLFLLQLLDAFAMDRSTERERYHPFRRLPARTLLWHGSRAGNYCGILSQVCRAVAQHNCPPQPQSP